MKLKTNFRPFTSEDASLVLSWIKSERELKLWSADQYGEYPIRPEDIVENYKKRIQEGEFYPLMFEINGKAVGHLILRFPYNDKKIVRLGFIIVHRRKRRTGIGSMMITDAMCYANTNFGATKFNLGVFINNTSALKCYENLGFKPALLKKGVMKFHNEVWDWEEMYYDPMAKIVDDMVKLSKKIRSDMINML